MKPSPFGFLDAPKEWSTTASKPNGEVVTLKEAWSTLSFNGLAMLKVDVPGKGPTTVYGNLSGLDLFDIPEGTDGTLAREDLEANGFTDETLEAWARDKHGVTLKLAGEKDTPELHVLRGDAYTRFLAETEW